MPLRLLGVTNTYPPAAGGGYGQIASDVMAGLAGRGHDVLVLVGSGPADVAFKAGGTAGVEVQRSLTPALGAWRRPPAAWRAVTSDNAALTEALERHRPHAALVWHMRGLVKYPLRRIHEAGIPVLYLLHDRWVLYERPGSIFLPWGWIDRTGLGRVRDRLWSPPIGREGIVCFNSQWLRRDYAVRGFTPAQNAVIPCGLDDGALAPPHEAPAERLLFAGRITKDKGLDVAIEALALSRNARTLSIAGAVQSATELAEMRDRADRLGVTDRVTWLGDLHREQLLQALRSHGTLLYPSRMPESFGLGLLEGMAAGMSVVTSARGGPEDFLNHGVNCFRVPAGDATATAKAVDAAIADRLSRAAMRASARATAERYRLDAVLDAVELEMTGRVGAAPSASGAWV